MEFLPLENRASFDFDTKIQELETKIGFTLPRDYKLFLKTHNGVIPNHRRYSCMFRLKRCSEKEDFLHVLYGLFLDDERLTLAYNYDFRKQWFGKSNDILPIGNSPFGVTLILKANGKVFAWDDTFYYRSSNMFRCVYKISDSFTGFIDGLTWKQLDDGDHSK